MTKYEVYYNNNLKGKKFKIKDSEYIYIFGEMKNGCHSVIRNGWVGPCDHYIKDTIKYNLKEDWILLKEELILFI